MKKLLSLLLILLLLLSLVACGGSTGSNKDTSDRDSDADQREDRDDEDEYDEEGEDEPSSDDRDDKDPAPSSENDENEMSPGRDPADSTEQDAAAPEQGGDPAADAIGTYTPGAWATENVRIKFYTYYTEGGDNPLKVISVYGNRAMMETVAPDGTVSARTLYLEGETGVTLETLLIPGMPETYYSQESDTASLQEFLPQVLDIATTFETRAHTELDPAEMDSHYPDTFAGRSCTCYVSGDPTLYQRSIWVDSEYGIILKYETSTMYEDQAEIAILWLVESMEFDVVQPDDIPESILEDAPPPAEEDNPEQNQSSFPPQEAGEQDGFNLLEVPPANRRSDLTITAMRTHKEAYAVNEEITFTLHWTGTPDSSCWVGIIPADVLHGEEYTNDDNDLDYLYLYDLEPGDFTFTTQLEPGAYTLRVNETDDGGAELAWCRFTVY